MRRPFFTLEDAKAAFNLFCCVYGVGTLGMPGNFSRAGPAIATVALAFMAFANVYASVCICKVMLLAPTSVRTYGDLGEWCMGKWGHWLTVVAQMGVCLLVPCVFLVLGGSLLDGLFPDAFSESIWIVLMALLVLPVCLIPTLKEGAGAAFAGCMGTILADAIGIAVVMSGMKGHPTPPGPHLAFKQVSGAFGNLSLAYGAGIVIPALQRQHTEPTRMPRVVGVTLTVISCFFLTISGLGYSAVGCQISGNLLFSIYPDADTGLATLGFEPAWGAVVLAYLFMQLHVTIAFSVLLHPAFYIIERMVLGMHKKAPIQEEDLEIAPSYADLGTPLDPVKDAARRSSKMSATSMADLEKEGLTVQLYEEEANDYKGANTIKYVTMRIAVIAVLVALSVVLKDHFSDLSDFVGASAITLSCIILPIIFYLKKTWATVPLYEKIPAIVVVVICFVLGCYVTYTSGETLFTPSSSDIEFPYCKTEYQNTVYFNVSAANGD
ncbi:hypothetical protein BBJ28_00016705 [Nothophytophthora sp. Chile5]|nr:hypothetical protein BBJ28_00016705 [Nothophytophthora sp. Chile5]